MHPIDIITSTRVRLQWEHDYGSFLCRDFVTQLGIANTRRARRLWRALRRRGRVVTASHARRFVWYHRDAEALPGGLHLVA